MRQGLQDLREERTFQVLSECRKVTPRPSIARKATTNSPPLSWTPTGEYSSRRVARGVASRNDEGKGVRESRIGFGGLYHHESRRRAKYHIERRHQRGRPKQERSRLGLGYRFGAYGLTFRQIGIPGDKGRGRENRSGFPHKPYIRGGQLPNPMTDFYLPPLPYTSTANPS